MLRDKEMTVFDNLMDEINTLETAWDMDFLEALAWIGDNLHEYELPVCTEYRAFMRAGADMFAPKVEYVLVNSDGEEIV
jgi:hypothetical protein